MSLLLSHLLLILTLGSERQFVNAEEESSPPAALSDTADQIVWRSKRACGLNCAYFLLRAEGKRPDYTEMQERLLKEEFTSLRDIKLAAAEYGLPLRLARMTPEQLLETDKPVVAHFDLVDVRGETQGHFVVVTHADDESVQFVDGSTVLTRTLPWREFQRNWSGFVAHRATPDSWSGWSVFAFLTGLGGGWLVDRWLNRQRREPAPKIEEHFRGECDVDSEHSSSNFAAEAECHRA